MRQTNHRPGVVVIGSDFRALGVIRSLGRRRVPCVVIDNLPRSAWFSRYAVKRLRWHGPMGEQAFLEFLQRIASEHHVQQWLLVPMSDETVELVARNHEALAPLYRLVTQSWDILRWANEKHLAYQVARELAIPCPQTWYPGGESDLQTIQSPFPLIIKPVASLRLQHALRLKALPARDKEELLAQYHLASGILAPDQILVQEVIPGDGQTQFSVAAYCQEGRTLAWMTARRTRQYPIDYGLGSSFVEAVEVPEIVEPARQLLARMRLSGMVEVEFKYDRRTNQYKLLDINTRPWGWHTLAVACGLDFPWIQYCDACSDLPAIPAPRYGYRWVRVLTDLPAALQEMRAGTLSLRTYLRSLPGKTTFSVLDWRDPLPVFGDFASAVVRVLFSSLARRRRFQSRPQTPHTGNKRNVRIFVK
jgi:D-aspartate ligase